MVLVVHEFVRTHDPLIRDPLNTYTHMLHISSHWFLALALQHLTTKQVLVSQNVIKHQ